MQAVLVSVIVALRNDPDRHLLIDRMELTPFTTTTIINYNSFLALTRQPYLQGHEQFVSGRLLEMAERILHNLQKGNSCRIRKRKFIFCYYLPGFTIL
ncbi:MAG TPA: hypothetical protein VFS97_14475 [Nitrososphaeraceae archaeon]|nr:hypothetical protein [Nitrososphaeraceae archaeon]